MSRRPSQTSSSKRLERRAERDARKPGSVAPRARRTRPTRAVARKAGGRFSNVNWLPFLVGAAIIAVVAIIAYAVKQASQPAGPAAFTKAELNSDPKLPGVYVKPNPGPDGRYGTSDDRQHFGAGTKYPICSQDAIDKDNAITDVNADRSGVSTCYNSNPPTSGPHANPGPMPWAVLQNPAPKENLVHNMEHGGVVVWYNTDDPAVIKQLSDTVQQELDRKRLVVMSKYTEMEPNTIALTGWTRLDKFTTDQMDKKRVTDFIESHSRRFNPEGF